MEFIRGLLFITQEPRSGLTSRTFFYWRVEEIEDIPGDDIIEAHVWATSMGLSAFTYSGFLTIPLDQMNEDFRLIACIDITTTVEDLAEKYPRRNW